MAEKVKKKNLKMFYPQRLKNVDEIWKDIKIFLEDKFNIITNQSRNLNL